VNEFYISNTTKPGDQHLISTQNVATIVSHVLFFLIFSCMSVYFDNCYEQVLNILDSYGGPDAARGNLGLHRLIEALKHMLAVRMNLGDPNFVNIDDTIYKMLSPSFAKDIQHMIFDNTTFPPEYYMNRCYILVVI